MILGYLKTEYWTPAGNIRIRYLPLNAENDQLYITLKNVSKDGILKGICLFFAEKENADLELHLQDRYIGMDLSTTY